MEEQLQKTTLAKRIFIGIDLFVMASVLMLMPKWTWGIFPLYFYLVYFRANLSLMMLRNEKKALVGSLIMVAACIFMIMDTNYLFGGIRWHYFGISQTLMRYTEQEDIAQGIWLILFFWFFLAPFFNSIGRLFSKRKSNMAKWHDIFGMTYFKRTPWKSQIVNLFFLSLVFVAAEVIGLRGKTILGSIWSIPLSMAGLWLSARIFKISWSENCNKLWIIGGYVVLLTVLWASQYLYSEKLIVMMTSYIMGLALSYYTVSKFSQNATFANISKAATVSIITLFAIPILTLGYNVFSGMDYVRIGAFQNKAIEENYSEYNGTTWQTRMRDFKRQSFYFSRGAYLIKDREGNIGLRDRRGVIIPTQFEAVEDCMVPYFNVKKDGLCGIYDLSGDYMYSKYYWVEDDTKSELRIPCQFTSITPDFKEGYYVIVTDSKGDKGVLNLCETKGKGYYTDDNGNVTVSEVDETLVVPVKFEKIHYIKNDEYDYFVASKQVNGRELFWLYTIQGKEVANNCTSIVPVSLENIQATDIDGNTRNLLENI